MWSLSGRRPLVCVWQPLVKDAESLSGDLYHEKKNWTSLLEILCFQWNHGYGIIENVAEVFWGVYSIENASIWVSFSKSRDVVENLPHASRPSTLTTITSKKWRKLCSKIIVLALEVAEPLNISYGSTQHIVVHVLGMKHVAARLVPKGMNFPAWLGLNFWLNTKQKSLLSHRIRQIWLPVTFSYFQNSNIRSGERAMSRLSP